jgi:pimeloyl-ACP methyl ester carboxylesterase
LTRRAGPEYGRAVTADIVTSADGTPIAAWRSGAGPPLVLLHGTAADHARWRPVLPAFEQRFTVLAIDRRGRGGSGDAREWAIEREFEDVAAVVAHAGEEACLLGHSFGAICALRGAPHAPALRGLVLYEPPIGDPVASEELVAGLEELLAAGERDRLLARFMAEVAGVAPGQIEVMRSQPAWEGRLAAAHTIPRELRAANAQRFDPAAFAGLDLPALVLRGGASKPAMMASAAAVAAGLPQSRLVTLAGQGHTAMDTATELFVSEVLTFLGPPARTPEG